MGDESLYASQLPVGFAQGLSPEDSVRAQENYIQRWMQRTRLYHEALGQLGERNVELNSQVLDYRKALYIARYEHAYLNKHLDTTVAQAEMQSYYDTHSDVFKLESPRFRLLVVEAPASSKRLWMPRRLLEDVTPEGVQKLSTASVKEGFHVKTSPETWYSIRELNAMLLLDLNGNEWKGGRKRVERTAGDNIYMLRLVERLDSGAQSPFQCAQERLHRLILHQRKVDLLAALRTAKGSAKSSNKQGN